MVEPVSLELAKQHLRVFDSSEHDVINVYIQAAREWVENFTGHILYQRQFVEQFEAFGDYLLFHKQPIVSIASIAYDSADDDQVAFNDFAFSAGTYPLKVYPTGLWPSLRTRGYITVIYTAGYAANDAPDALVQAVLLMVGHFYTARSAVGPEALSEVPLAVRSLCAPFRTPVMA